jgi:hypothetical protein
MSAQAWSREPPVTEPRADEPLDETAFAIGELVDALEGMIAFSRAATFDEADGELEACERAKAMVARYKRDS